MSNLSGSVRAWLKSTMSASKAALFSIAAGLWAALGTFWSIYTWYHQEIVVPSATPVNLTTEVTIDDVGASAAPSRDVLQAIQLQVKAENVSTKNIYLLSNYWDAWAGRVEIRSENMNKWLQGINQTQAVQSETGVLHYSMAGRFYGIKSFERIAWSNLFPTSYILHPKETVST